MSRPPAGIPGGGAHETDGLLCKVMNSFPRAAVTKYCKPGGLDHIYCRLVWRPEAGDHGVSSSASLQGPYRSVPGSFPWLVDGRLLPESLHVVSLLCVCLRPRFPFPLGHRAGVGSTLRISL